MLKHATPHQEGESQQQPPSGGCVLKLLPLGQQHQILASAAFGRLCVETPLGVIVWLAVRQPPSGGCVLKHDVADYLY